MDSKQPSTAGTGQPARPGGDDSPVSPSSDWEDWYHATVRNTAAPTEQRADPEPEADPDRRAGSSSPAAQSSKRRRVAAVVTAASTVLAAFSAGVMYADLRTDRVTAAATAQQPLQPPSTRLPRSTRVPPATHGTSASPSPVVVQPPSNVPVVTQPVGNVRGAPPVRISIPALHIDQRLIGLGVRADRQLEVPQNYKDIGWWSTGPLAGDPGAAVMVGHLDSKVGPAVFYRLSTLAQGTPISVRRADGRTVSFRVTGRQSFSKEHFPDKLVYRTTGKSSLHLVTCGGSYDRSTGYRNNVVVFADLVKPEPVAKPKHSAKPQHSASSKTAVKPRPSDTHTPIPKADQATKPKVTSSTRASKAIADAYHRSVAGTAGPSRRAPSGR